MIMAYDKDGVNSSNSSNEANANSPDEDVENGDDSSKSGTERKNSFKHHVFSSNLVKNRDSTPKSNQR